MSPLGFGAFKIGRNEGIKYDAGYDLPDDEAVRDLLHGVLDLGITLIDTAPAYGISEARIGDVLAQRRREFTLCTKAGEDFANGRSRYDYSSSALRRSVRRSLDRLQTDVIDILLVHSNGDDRAILEHTDAVMTFEDLRDTGLVRAIGFSGKTAEGTELALAWADVVMVEHHPDDADHAGVLTAARDAGVGVLIKKPLGSGRLAPAEALPNALAAPAVTSAIVGSLSLEHLAENVRIVEGRA